MSIGKTVAAAACACALALCGVFAAGCASPADHLRSERAADLDGVKALDDETVSLLVSNLTDEERNALTTLGIDPAEYLRAYYDGFDYTIEDVVVDGESAQVTLTVCARTTLDVNTAITNAFAEVDFESVAASGLDATSVGPAVLDAVRATTPVWQESVTVPYLVVDDMWAPADYAGDLILEPLPVS